MKWKNTFKHNYLIGAKIFHMQGVKDNKNGSRIT